MLDHDARELQLGLYRIFWYSGGSSLAAVGQGHDGRRWYAPINWVSGPGWDWSSVKSVEPYEKDEAYAQFMGIKKIFEMDTCMGTVELGVPACNRVKIEIDKDLNLNVQYSEGESEQ